MLPRLITVSSLATFFYFAQCIAAESPTEPVVIPNSETHYLSSQINGVNYKLYIGLPNAYTTSKIAFDVLYLLDADYSFAIARNIVEHLSDRNRIKPVIVVGIAYAGPPNYRLHRTRDYTPYFVKEGGYGEQYQVVSGGADKFQRFLADELFPYIKRHFRSSEKRYLSGHSFGGLFAAWSALTRPELFNGYIIVSPSLWYADKNVFSLTAKNQEKSQRSVRIYFSVGANEINHEHNMVGDLTDFARELRQQHKRDDDIKLLVADGEIHDSIYPSALSNGLRFLIAQ